MRIKSIFKSILIVSLLFLIAAKSEKNTKILILGDSLTDGYGIDRKDAFATLIQQELIQTYPNLKIINGGQPGATTASGVKRLKWYLRSRPDIILIALGSNDGLRGITVESSKKNLSNIIQEAKQKNIPVGLIGAKVPPNYGKEYSNAFDKIFVDLKKEENVPLLPFILKDVAGNKDLNLADGIHPNEEGHKVISKHILKFIQEHFAKYL